MTGENLDPAERKELAAIEATICPGVIELIECKPSVRGIAGCTQPKGHDGSHMAVIAWPREKAT